MVYTSKRTVESLTYRQKVLLMFGIFLCMELAFMVSTEFSVALPSIITDIGGGDFYALVFTVNLVTSALVTPTIGKLSDIYGRRKILIIGIIVILISEILTPMLVSNIYHLMIFRAIQGIGGASTAVIGLIIISDIFDVQNRARFLGFYGSLNAMTSVIAPTLGGIIVQYYSWHWIFYSIVPVGIIGLVIVLIYMPKIPTTKNTKVDHKGILLLSTTTLSLIAITTFGGKFFEWSSLTSVALFILMFSAFLLFVYSQKKAEDPIIPLKLFKYRVFTICIIGLLGTTFVITGLSYFVPLMLQNIHGYTPTQTGLFVTQRGAVAFVFAAIGGLLVAKLKDFKIVAIGAMIILTSVTIALTFFTTSITTAQVTTIFLIWGTGSGILLSIFHSGIQMNLPNREISSAMGVVQLIASMGAVLATSILGSVIATENLSQGFLNLLFTCLSVIGIVLFIFIIFIPRKKHTDNIEVHDHPILEQNEPVL